LHSYIIDQIAKEKGRRGRQIDARETREKKKRRTSAIGSTAIGNLKLRVLHLPGIKKKKFRQNESK